MKLSKTLILSIFFLVQLNSGLVIAQDTNNVESTSENADKNILADDVDAFLTDSTVYMYELNAKLNSMKSEMTNRQFSDEEVLFLGSVQQHITDVNSHIEYYQSVDLSPEQSEKVDTLWTLNKSNFRLWAELSSNIVEDEAPTNFLDKVSSEYSADCAKIEDEETRNKCIDYGETLFSK